LLRLTERKAVQVLKQLLESQEKLEARLEQMTLANRQLGQTEPKFLKSKIKMAFSNLDECFSS
jgi:hypothetical protein